MRKQVWKLLLTGMLGVALFTSSLSCEALALEEKKEDDVITLRVCNWEEYIDEGDWDEEETIDLESGDILGVNHMADDFEEWYQQTYGKKVKVEYSTFGTNEDLYNMLTLGDEYDLVCPSEYMIMKLMAEQKLEPLSDDFFDTSDPNNYYSIGVSPYIKSVFDNHEIGGEKWSKYAAGYMWGITGVVYNPEIVSKEEASSWHIFDNPKYKHQVTIKDNVRDTYFSAAGALKHDLLTSEEFVNSPSYKENLEKEMNDTSEEFVGQMQDYLQMVKDNVYSFETDSGKSDMITGKVVANYQWSGDAVYTLDQAEEDDFTLNFAVPNESTNIYFDGWVMLRCGVQEDPNVKHAAQAFINYLSRPDNVIRNMYYIGYTSVISGGEDERILEYADWCYGAEEDATDTTEYSLAYFFAKDGVEDEDASYTLTVEKEQLDRQLVAQYPMKEMIDRSSIMVYFDKAESERINQMWINIRCYNLTHMPVWLIVCISVGLIGMMALAIRKKIEKQNN